MFVQGKLFCTVAARFRTSSPTYKIGLVRLEDNCNHDVIEEDIGHAEKLIDESETNANAKSLDEQTEETQENDRKLKKDK